MRRKTGATPSSVRPEHVHRELHDRGTAHAGRRFLWGRGYITTKKVRFLHASMRYMLLHPQQFHASHGGTAPPTNLAQVIARRTHAWDVQSLGLPVNQEDLAYTLLTFGYMIPLGLEHWGCRFSTPEKEAFLHHWRLIGHVLGVEDELMTDDWTAAGQLYERIQRHQAAASPDGVALTRTLTNFLEDYLPKLGGLNRTLPPLAIADLVGANATMLFTPADWQAARSPAKQLVWATSRTTLRWFNWTRSLVARHLPGVANFYSAIIFRVSDELVQSCWGAYRRKPFYVPKDESSWTLQTGADPAFIARLTDWRRRVFNWLFVGLGCLFAGTFGTLAAVGLWLFDHELAWLIFLGSRFLLFLTWLALDCTLNRVFAERPRLVDPVHKPKQK